MTQKNEREKPSNLDSVKKKDSSFWEDVAINVAIIAATSFVGGLASAAGASTFNRVTSRSWYPQEEGILNPNVVDIRSAV